MAPQRVTHTGGKPITKFDKTVDKVLWLLLALIGIPFSIAMLCRPYAWGEAEYLYIATVVGWLGYIAYLEISTRRIMRRLSK
jgi:hypothetical protein